MTGRSIWHLSFLICLLLLAGCGSTPYISSIQVSPATQTLASVGATVQFQAIGTFSNRKHPQTQQNVTDQVTWTSSAPSIATVSATGLATAATNGTTTITASSGAIIGTATLTVTITGGGGSGGSSTLASLTIIPATGIQSVNLVGETAQYIAIGTFTGNPVTQDMTDQVTWSSSDVRIATINSAGLATAVGSCGTLKQETTITALATSSTGAVIAGTSDLTMGSCGQNNLPTLTVYEVGQGTGTVTSVPAGINCGSGAGCTANFVLGTQVSLTAVAAPGSTFVGWSANCKPPTSSTCSVTMTDNATVGAIFNLSQ
jgi:hypothetical protein